MVLSPHVHSRLQSSISNFTFGGTQVGWIGETSVPMTSVSGNSSAKSLTNKTLSERVLWRQRKSPLMAKKESFDGKERVLWWQRKSRLVAMNRTGTHMAQSPDPVAISSALCVFFLSSGARYSLPSVCKTRAWCLFWRVSLGSKGSCHCWVWSQLPGTVVATSPLLFCGEDCQKPTAPTPSVNNVMRRVFTYKISIASTARSSFGVHDWALPISPW